MREVVGYFGRRGVLETATTVPANPKDVIVAQIIFPLVLVDVSVQNWQFLLRYTPCTHNPPQHHPPLEFFMKGPHAFSYP
jgi:hypothetical protein